MAATQAVLNAIYGVLYADAGAGGVNTLTGGRIYETQAPQDCALPHVVYTQATDGIFSTFDEDTSNFELQVDCYGTRTLGMAAVRTLAERVKTLLNRQSVAPTGWAVAKFHKLGDGMPSVEEDADRITLRFRVFAS